MKKLQIILLILFYAVKIIGQNNITVNVIVNPPYSHDIRDYVNQPGKILAILTASPLIDIQNSQEIYKIKLIGSITGDNGISLRTMEAYRPPVPIELMPGQSIQLTANEIEPYLSADNLILQGITKNELLTGKGLPEGSYTICIQAVDYETNEPLSEEEPFGCSAPFDLRYIEPPQLTFPFCGEEVEVLSPQNITFQWTMPVGVINPSTLRYKFQLFEIPEGSDPQAIVNSATPPFFEQTDIPSTLLVYNMAMPVLDIEKTYAWVVIAEDLNEKIQFANNGKSEVCTFLFEKGEVVTELHEFKKEEIVITNPAYNSSDSILIASNKADFYVSWLFSSLIQDNNIMHHKTNKDNSNNISIDTIMKGYENSIFKLEFYSNSNAKNIVYSSKTKNIYFQADPQSSDFPFVSEQPYWFRVYLIDSLSNKQYLKSELCAFKYQYIYEQEQEYVSKTINGILKYMYQGKETQLYPVSNVNIKLVKKYILKDQSTGEEIEVPENTVIQQLNNSETGERTYTVYNKPSVFGLAYTTTNQSGYFSFNLNWPKDEKLGLLDSLFNYSAQGKSYSGNLSRVIKIETINSYYAPMIQNIIPNEDITNLGVMTTYVYSYSLKAEIEEGYKNVSGLSKPLVNKNVYLFRKNKDSSIPFFEGEIQTANQMQAVPYPLVNAGYKLIASEKTELSKNSNNNDIAVVNFSNLLQNKVNGQDYFLWVEGTPIETAQLVRYNAQDIEENTSSGGWTYVQTVNIVSSSENTTSYSEIKDYSFAVNDKFTVISDEPPKSTVKGQLIYTYPGKPTTIRPLANTNISVIACFVNGPDGNSKIVKKKNTNERYEESFLGAEVLGTGTTNSDGSFEFEFANIPLIYPYSNTGEFEVSTGKLNNEQMWQAWESYSETDFRIKYQAKTGSIRRVFRIVVEDPNGLYMSPEDNFDIEPLQTKNIGTLTSHVFTYKLNGIISHTYYSTEGTYINPYGEEQSYINLTNYAIPGVECYLLRRQDEIEHLNLPEGEGENIIGTLDEYPDYKIISFDTTNAEGYFNFDNVLFRNTNAPIYFFFRTSEMKGTENYEPKFLTQETINPFTKPRFFFNSDYDYTTIKGAGSDLKPAPPSIRGKVISNINAQKGVKNAHCNLFVFLKSSSLRYYHCLTDEEGYFDFTNELKQISDLGDVEKVKIIVAKEGFYYNQNGQNKPSWVKEYGAEFVQEGRQIVEDNIFLSAKGGLKGRVKNEKGEYVDAYVKFDENRGNQADIGESSINMTFSALQGGFNIPAIPGQNRKLIIIPKDVAYFEDTMIVNVNEGASTLIENIVVKERSHRIWFYVKKTAGNNGYYSQIVPFPGAKVKLLGDDNTPVAIANSQGKVELNFKNVSVNNLSLQVSGPTNSNYVPKIISFQNEESKTPVKLDDVVLKEGISLKGIVKLDDQPTNKAQVYVDLAKGTDTQLIISSDGTSNSESQYYYETSPKSDGTFELNCLPPELKGKKIKVKAVYKPNTGITSSSIMENIQGNTTNNSNSNNQENNVIPLPDNSNKTVIDPSILNGNNNQDKNTITFNPNVNYDNSNESDQSTVTNMVIGQQPTVIGDSKEVYMIPSLSTFQLNLRTYNKMSIKNIWGFPLEITGLQELSNDKVKVSGRVKLQGYSKSFDPIASTIYEISSVIFEPSDQMAGNIPVGMPQDNKVIVSTQREAKMKYAHAYNIKFSKKPGEQSFVIEKGENNSGIVKGFVQIVDNSFQYPSSYLNFEGTQFYFAKEIELPEDLSLSNVSFAHRNRTSNQNEETDNNNQIQNSNQYEILSNNSQYDVTSVNNQSSASNLLLPFIEVFNSSKPGNGNSTRLFQLCNVLNESSGFGSNLRFKFINFNTTASISGSYINGNQIILDATLNANVENAGNVSINIGRLVLKNNSIDPVSGDKSILITLNDQGIHSADAKPWQIEAFDWIIDPQQGGLVSKNCMLHTGKLDFPIKEFNLRSDFAYVGDIELQGINLGGYPIQITSSESVFGYNQSTGSDKRGHWQLIVFPNSSGQAPGKVHNLPHLSGTLEIETISLLSNGEDIFGIGPGAGNMKLYNTVNFNPLLLNTIPDGFVLSGGVDFKIPNVKQGLGTRLLYSTSSGNTTLVVDPINIEFEGPGNVLFKPDLYRNGDETRQTFYQSQQKFEAYGTVEEPGTLNPINVLLTYDAKSPKTEIKESPLTPNQTVKIGSSNTYLSTISCSMNATATSWNNLKFEGNLDGFGENGMEENNRRVNFTVFGEIKATNQGFKAKSMTNSFSGIEMSYENGRILGSLSMHDFPLGSSKVNGTANILMDKEGWAFYSSASVSNIPVPEPATVNAGVLIGNYPTVTTDMKNTVLAYAINKQMPPTFSEGLKGFYMVAGRDLPIKGLDIDIDVVVAKAYVEVPMAGVDASFYMNFANGQETIGGALNGGLQILFGLESITCTSLSGDARATIGVGGKYSNGKILVEGNAEFSSSLRASQGIPIPLGGCQDALSLGIDVEGGFNFTSNPYNVKFYLNKP